MLSLASSVSIRMFDGATYVVSGGDVCHERIPNTPLSHIKSLNVGFSVDKRDLDSMLVEVFVVTIFSLDVFVLINILEVLPSSIFKPIFCHLNWL
jgi:hypothetical protein